MERFTIGDILVYDIYGLCRVKEIRNMSFDKNVPGEEYYVLSPVSAAASVYYIPVGNERAVSKLRRPLVRQELEMILSQAKDNDFRWIENRQLRGEVFNSALSKGVTPELISIMRCLWCRKQTLLQKGKRLSTADESFFSAAGRLMTEEIAFVFQIEKEGVMNYISSYFDSV